MKMNMRKLLNSFPSDEEIAKEHAAADRRCGRKWECACAACRKIRKEATTNSQF